MARGSGPTTAEAFRSLAVLVLPPPSALGTARHSSLFPGVLSQRPKKELPQNTGTAFFGTVMKPFCRVAIATASVALTWVAYGADATSPVDYTRRNGPFAPGSPVTTEKTTPAADRTLEDRRVEKPTVRKPAAVIGDRRAAVDVMETNPKAVQAPTKRETEIVSVPTSALDHRAAAISTAADTRKPARVTQYQEEMAAASARMMAAYPALDRATTAKINRFVFRKNNPDVVVPDSTRVTPAAGGPVLRP